MGKQFYTTHHTPLFKHGCHVLSWAHGIQWQPCQNMVTYVKHVPMVYKGHHVKPWQPSLNMVVFKI